MSLFKRKPPEKEEEIEVPELTSSPPRPPIDSERDAFPLPAGAHAPVGPRPIPNHMEAPKNLPAAERPVPEPLARPKRPAEMQRAPAPEPEPMDAPEPVVERSDALSELEELLKPGAPKTRTARGLVRIADITEPEILKAFVELVANPVTVSIVDNLAGSELSLEEIAARTNNPPEKVKRVLQQLVCLGLVEDFWYKTPSEKHINKFKFVNTTGTLDFDLKDLGKGMPVEELEEKSTNLVNIISREGKVPKSLVMKELELELDTELEQILRFTERFKLPNVKTLVIGDIREIAEETRPLATEVKIPKTATRSGFETEFEALEGYMKKLENVKK